MDDIYEIAGLDEELRLARIAAAEIRVGQAERVLAAAKTGHALALMRKLVPAATEFRFAVSEGDHGRYAMIHRIDNRQADEVLLDLDNVEESAVDSDALVPVEDYLAGAAEAGAEFPRGERSGEYVLRLVP